jgi:monofunctional biosynthetic peptidoglycan transglycosylase
VFSGVLSLENNGGFASVRIVLEPRDLSDWSGLEIRARGDGRTYQLRLRTDDRFDGIAYRASFETHDGEWRTVRIPFSEFTPTFRGRMLSDVPPLDPSQVRQLGFMLADRKPGAFSLEVEFVQTWGSSEP